MHPSEVFKRTAIKIQSQFHIVSRWKKRNFVIIRDGGRRGKQPILSKDQVDWVINVNSLESMEHLSLTERERIIMERFELKAFSSWALRLYYLRYGV